MANVPIKDRFGVTPPQCELFEDLDRVERVEPAPHFRDPDPRDIYFGGTRLDETLKKRGRADALVVRKTVRSLDLDEIIGRYQAKGRAAYHPAVMIGLILYGLVKGRSSLRALEDLAAADLGAMWICGGVIPDHSSLSRFINRHEDWLSGELFEQIARKALKAGRRGGQRIAIDGTVLQAMGSRYARLSEEAAAEAEAEARRAAAAAPGDPAAQAAAKRATEAREAVEARANARRTQGKDASRVAVTPAEPEAVIQQQKDKSYAPSYKPSVASTPERVVVAHAVDPSSETAVVADLLEQTENVTGERIRQVLGDAGYCVDEVIRESIERDIDLLVPQERDEKFQVESGKRFTKKAFAYDDVKDIYICPAGHTLRRVETYAGSASTPAYTKYGGAPCTTCPLRARCTEAKNGRHVRRYAGDDAKDALRTVMKHPRARQIYAHRKAWVEPVFGALRHIQGMRRFRRRGLRAVRVEFALHVSAHNLRRLLALSGNAAERGIAAGIRAFRALVRTLLRTSPVEWTGSQATLVALPSAPAGGGGAEPPVPCCQ